MTTIYIGAEHNRELTSILNNMMELGYFDWYDEESIEIGALPFADYEHSYIRNYGDIQAVYNSKGFRGRTVFSVDVEE